jgi:hypothetical protein
MSIIDNGFISEACRDKLHDECTLDSDLCDCNCHQEETQ